MGLPRVGQKLPRADTSGYAFAPTCRTSMPAYRALPAPMVPQGDGMGTMGMGCCRTVRRDATSRWATRPGRHCRRALRARWCHCRQQAPLNRHRGMRQQDLVPQDLVPLCRCSL